MTHWGNRLEKIISWILPHTSNAFFIRGSQYTLKTLINWTLQHPVCEVDCILPIDISVTVTESTQWTLSYTYVNTKESPSFLVSVHNKQFSERTGINYVITLWCTHPQINSNTHNPEWQMLHPSPLDLSNFRALHKRVTFTKGKAQHSHTKLWQHKAPWTAAAAGSLCSCSLKMLS